MKEPTKSGAGWSKVSLGCFRKELALTLGCCCGMRRYGPKMEERQSLSRLKSHELGRSTIRGSGFWILAAAINPAGSDASLPSGRLLVSWAIHTRRISDLRRWLQEEVA